MDITSFLIGKKVGGGESTTVEALSVTQNGTTTAPAGKAYSPVTVNVPNSYTAGDEGKVVSSGALVAQTAHAKVTENGVIDTTLNNSVEIEVSGGGGGASNVVIGDFTGASAGALTVQLGYSGTGYPISVLITPYEGAYNTSGDAFSDTMSNVPLVHSIVKSISNTEPTYGTSGEENEGAVLTTYRTTGTTVANSGTTSGTMHFNLFTSASTNSVSFPQICKLHSATQMEVRIKADTSSGYGFPAGLKYRYIVVYSA